VAKWLMIVFNVTVDVVIKFNGMKISSQCTSESEKGESFRWHRVKGCGRLTLLSHNFTIPGL
jgi:hypothetical protein